MKIFLSSRKKENNLQALNECRLFSLKSLKSLLLYELIDKETSRLLFCFIHINAQDVVNL